MNKSFIYDCKKSFVRKITFSGHGGEIRCEFYWLHATITVAKAPKFNDGIAEITDILEINFNDSIYPRGGSSWPSVDIDISNKVQKIFDKEDEIGDPTIMDGRDKCIDKKTIAKILKLGFTQTSDKYFIDKKYTILDEVVAEVKELN